MWTMTGFADEISADLGEQLDLLNELKISHVEFRSAWGVKVLDLSEEQLAQAKSMLDAKGVRVSSVGSDLGKIFINDDFGPHLERARHAIEVARLFETSYIRMFSFFIPEGDDPARWRDEVLARTKAMVELAEAGGITLLHENEKDIYGDTPERVVDLMTSINSANYRAIFDPANYVQCGVKPFDEAFAKVDEYTDYLHCKDALASVSVDGLEKVVPCGEGDGQVFEVVGALRDRGYAGFCSIEPHLGSFDAFGGMCGPQLWTRAFRAFEKVLNDQGIAWQ